MTSTATPPNLAEKKSKWKTHGKAFPVRVSNATGKTAEGEVYIQSWNAQERTRRALKWLGILWGVGAFCILFPIIHFILPPLLLLAGPTVAYLLFQQSTAVLGGVGQCPSCEAQFEIVRGNYLKPSDQWPLTDLCSQCREDVTIQLVAG